MTDIAFDPLELGRLIEQAGNVAKGKRQDALTHLGIYVRLNAAAIAALLEDGQRYRNGARA
jgi:hypothetical protein